MARVRRAFGPNPPGPAPPGRVLDWDLAERRAAVLCALFEEAGEARVILTRRSSMMRSHTGQVSFPGGRVDEGEEPLAAALREASEEVGIDPGQVDILGQLAPLATVRGRVLIDPFVGVLASRPMLRTNPAEVEQVFDVPLSELLSDPVYHEELWPRPDGDWLPVSFFELGDDTVWGATATMLRQLLEIVVVDASPGEDGHGCRRDGEGWEE